MSSHHRRVGNSGGTGNDSLSYSGQSQCSHNHDHSHHHHHHGGGHGGAVEMTTTASPAAGATEVFSFPSVNDLLAGTPQELMKVFATLLRFGRFEALQPLIEGLLLQHQKQQQEGGVSDDLSSFSSPSTNTKNKSTLQYLLQSHDDGGHSLLHWAAKRGDDIRFLQTLVELSLEMDLKSTINIPRYVPCRVKPVASIHPRRRRSFDKTKMTTTTKEKKTTTTMTWMQNGVEKSTTLPDIAHTYSFCFVKKNQQ